MVLIFDAHEHLEMLKPHYKNPMTALKIMVEYFLSREFYLEAGTYWLPNEYHTVYSRFQQNFLMELADVGSAITNRSYYNGVVNINKTDLWITLTPSRTNNHDIPTTF